VREEIAAWTVGDIVLVGVSLGAAFLLIGIFYQCAKALTDWIYRNQEE
jgi:hypothetical protein